MLRRVSPLRADVSEELSASFIGVTRIGELGTTLSVISNRSKLRRNTKQQVVLGRNHKAPFSFPQIFSCMSVVIFIQFQLSLLLTQTLLSYF
jgi:hypothetical protein